jgi:hypothetical protein
VADIDARGAPDGLTVNTNALGEARLEPGTAAFRTRATDSSL